MTFVLDSSAFFSGIQPQDVEDSATTQLIVKEIRDPQAKIRIYSAVESGKLKIIEPLEKYMMIIETEARKSGDIKALSQADKSILALAFQVKSEEGKVILVSDDYAVMNLCSILEIPYQATFEKGIKRIIKWQYVCSGCFKKYPPDYGEPCEVCGSKIIRKRKKEI